MRLLAALAVGLVVAAAFPAASAPLGQEWRSKADEPLLAAYDAKAAGPLSVMVQGPPIPAPAAQPQDRAAWRAHWAAEAAPFFGLVRAEAQRLGGEVTSEIAAVNVAHVALVRDRVPELVGLAMVRRAGLDWPDAVHIQTSEPGILATLSQTVAKVEAPDLWALGLRGEGVKLAMIDTGIRPTHEMFNNSDGSTRVIGWYDATGPAGACATPCDTQGHGTHTASTAAGSNLFNSSSPQGVAPRAQILGVRIFQGTGGPWADAQEGLQAAFDLGAEVTSNSWGGGCDADGTATAELADTLTDAGMISVFAAGNSGAGGVGCPGVVHRLVTVGAVDINEVVASFSSRGPCAWQGVSKVCPDVMAVGVDVIAAGISSDTAYVPNSGTSMATPHVAGLVALLQQARKAQTGHGLDAPAAEADILLRYTAKDLGAAGPDNDDGWGLAKGKQADDLMTSPAALNVQDRLGIPFATLRGYQTNSVGFNVANLGSAEVSGTLEMHIAQTDTGLCPPTCDVADATKSVSLANLREADLTVAFEGATHAAGRYSVTARFSYTYVDPVDGLTKSGLIERTGSFLLKKVSFVKTRAVPGVVHVGDVVFAGVTLANVGNENASGLVFTERFDAVGLAPLPSVPPGSGNYGAFANPGPNNVNFVVAAPRVLIESWTIGAVNAGSQWVMTYNFAGGQPGDYAFAGTLQYRDEAAHLFNEAF
ncbi:MAG TPA: S8 family serine peptidase, partial [Candidatus Thermoplasmatota archaeon]|nr:S8 family serine peptidase [Candidatus Thermoplasmatota archaeon]